MNNKCAIQVRQDPDAMPRFRMVDDVSSLPEQHRRVKRVIIVGPPLIRGLIADRLAGEPGLSTSGVADTAGQGLTLALMWRPDVVLVDVDGESDIDAASRIPALLPHIHMVVLTNHATDRQIQEALDRGVSGVVSKHDALGAVVSAIRAAADGETYLSPEVSHRLVIRFNADRTTRTPQTKASTLTVRELQVLRDIAQGMARKNIATRLGLSIKTIDRHCANLKSKLHIFDRVELTRFAIREGLASV